MSFTKTFHRPLLFAIWLLAALVAVNFTSAHAQTNSSKGNYEYATLGGGCFWCVEAIYENVQGVIDVESGFAGGHVENPSYRQVITGRTGHAEVVRITYDPAVVSYETILEVFWHTHDPTTLNRQGNDIGPQYRSAIFYANEKQRSIAEASRKNVEDEKLWKNSIVTTLEPLNSYTTAEDYHQDYFENNPRQSYCAFVIAPKVKKFKKEFAHLLKNADS